MFVMTNDGGVAEESSSETHAARVLLQRVFIYNLLCQGLSVTLLKGAQYRDSKVRLSRIMTRAVIEVNISPDTVLRLRTEDRQSA